MNHTIWIYSVCLKSLNSQYDIGGMRGLKGSVESGEWIRCSPCKQGVEGSTPTGGTCLNDFSDPIDQDIRTQWALSWKIVVSEWRSVIAVSLNVGGGVCLIKLAKLCMCTQNTTNTTRMDARRRVCAAMVPYRWATRGMSLRELEYTHTLKGSVLQLRRGNRDNYRIIFKISPQKHIPWPFIRTVSVRRF